MSAFSRRKGAARNPCECGCGHLAPIHSVTGEPARFVHGHNGKKNLDDLYRVQDRGWISMCWIWFGGKNTDGRYGRCKYGGRMQPAHRVFFERAGGVIPEGHELDHLCRVTLCVNPSHLEPVTPAQNVRRSTSTPLTDSDIVEIRAARVEALATDPWTAAGTPRKRVRGGLELRRQLGERYGVTADTIKRIWAGKTWA